MSITSERMCNIYICARHSEDVVKTKTPGPTQPCNLSGTRNEKQVKCVSVMLCG